MNRKIIFLSIASLSIVLSSCASTQSRKIMSAFDDESHQTMAEKEKQDYYILGPDDVIHVMVNQHPEWSGEYIIRPNGKIMITDLGEITVGDVTKSTLEANLMAYLLHFIKEPKVTVDIVKYASQVIYVLGQVNKPGKLSTEGKIITLRDAIVLAGLPTRFARDGTVFVISPSRTHPKKQVINLARILYHGELKNNIEVLPGDIVYVPENFWGIINDLFSTFLSPLSTARYLAVAP